MKHTRIILILFSFLSLLAFAQEPPPPPEGAPPSPEDLETCKQVVTNYCNAWKAADFDAMYALLGDDGNDGMGRMEKEKFVKQQNEYLGWGCKLTAFEIQEASPDVEEVKVKVQFTFEKEIKPTMINGTHTVQLIKDGEDWKIKNVVAPSGVLPENLPTGGNPGN